MQIFEVVELQEFPYMETREVAQGQVVGDILYQAIFFSCLICGLLG